MAKRKLNLTKYVKDRWKLTSRLVRLSASDHTGMCSCVTCGKTKHYKELQAGHFIPQAQGNAVKWDLRNIHPQCYRCNINLGGNGAEYYPYMEKRYGTKVVSELRRLSNTTVKLTIADHKEAIKLLEQQLKEVENGI